MADEIHVAHIQAAKELTIELLRSKPGLAGSFQDTAKATAEAYKLIYRAVVKAPEH